MSDTVTLTEVDMDWDNFDRVIALRYEEEFVNDRYWDGESWIRKGFHRDCHGVIVCDEFEGQYKIDEKPFDI